MMSEQEEKQNLGVFNAFFLPPSHPSTVSCSPETPSPKSQGFQLFLIELLMQPESDRRDFQTCFPNLREAAGTR